MAGRDAQGGAQAFDRRVGLTAGQLQAGEIALDFDVLRIDLGRLLQRDQRIDPALQSQQGDAV